MTPITCDFTELIQCIPGLHLLVYATDHTLLEASSDEAAFFRPFFDTSDYLDLIEHHSRTSDVPYIISNYMGLVWEAVIEKNADEVNRICILGPILYTPFADRELEQTLREYENRGLTFSSKHKLIRMIKSLPVMTYTQFGYFGQMLHCALNGNDVALQDFQMLSDTEPHVTSSSGASKGRHPSGSFAPSSDAASASRRQPPMTPGDRTDAATYENIHRCESLLLQEVASGIDGLYHEETLAMQKSGSFALMPSQASGVNEPVRLRKDTLISMNTLYCRQAVDAGALAGTAYRMQDAFIHEIESSHTPLGMNELQSKMHTSYCALVKESRRSNQTYSEEIRKCLAYIDQNSTGDCSAKALAQLTGYASYYITGKFKKETGKSVAEYIREKKIKYAATLLKAGNDSISDIAEKVGYSSYAHFCSDFKAVQGCTPSDYGKADSIKNDSALR